MNIDLAYILAVVALLWPIVKMISQIIYTRFEQKLPANINAVIKDCATTAVQSIEQTGAGVSSEEKKAVALDIVKKSLLAAKLPIPNMMILGAAIEAAVWLMKQEQKS